MNAKKSILPYLLVLSVLIGVTSCKSFLNEHSEDLAYIQTLDDLDQLLMGSGYMEVNPRTPLKYSNFYFPYIHYISDETQEVIGETRYSPEANIRPVIFGYYTWQKSVGESFDGLTHNDESVDWLRLYNHISTLNVVLSEIEDIDAPTATEKKKKNRIIAEASFLRAAYHFWLVNLYAEAYSPEHIGKPGIPLKLEKFIKDTKYKRASIQTVYQTILEDLQRAEALMPSDASSSKYRISQQGILLYMSRVYLYMQEWSKAIAYAQKAISKGSTLTNINGWSKDNYFLSLANPEVLFSMGGSLVYAQLSSSSPIGAFEVSKELYDLYGDSDLRKTVYFKKESLKGGQQNYHVYPVKQNPKGPYRAEVSDIFCLRLSEAYLNLSEALAMSNDLAKSNEVINQLLQMRTKVSDFHPINITDQKELISFLREERRKELCFEGHRWLDLKRYREVKAFPYKKGLVNTYTIYTKEGRNSRMQATYEYLLPANEDAGYTLPIPLEEKAINDVIVDNERVERKPTNIKNYD